MTHDMAITDLAALGESLECGEDVDVDTIQSLISRIESAATGWSNEEGRAVYSAVESFVSSVAMAQAVVQEKLKNTKTKEKGVKGYGHLRSFQRGQKLFRKA